jgi:hypothetical protein
MTNQELLEARKLYISEVDTPNSWIGTGFSAICELGIAKGYYPIIHFGNVFFR